MGGERYVIGVDFGTLSGRALVVRVSDGAEVAGAVPGLMSVLPAFQVGPAEVRRAVTVAGGRGRRRLP